MIKCLSQKVNLLAHSGHGDLQADLNAFAKNAGFCANSGYFR
jgi:hypothetical protein